MVKRVKLKDKSPEFLEEEKPQIKTDTHTCSHKNCNEEAPFKAPKNSALNEYQYFCDEHIKVYNKSWNYFSDMTEEEIENYINNSTIWDRPTRKFSDQEDMEEYLRAKVKDEFFTDRRSKYNKQNDQRRREAFFKQSGTEEAKAMEIMGLLPPVTLPDIKAKYKKLVKINHPDLHGGCKKAEEKLKDINMAYTVLKIAYESFSKLDIN